jgi:hypothetical protein
MLPANKNRTMHTPLQSTSQFRKTIALACLTFTLLALTGAVQAQEVKLGRLFSNPSERNNLDKLRLQNKLGENAPTEEIATPTETNIPAAAPSIQVLTHNGFVKRSNGTETTWINQVPSDKQKASANIRVKQQLSKVPVVTVTLPSGKRQELKVGQSFDISTGKVREVYEVPASSTASDKAAVVKH